MTKIKVVLVEDDVLLQRMYQEKLQQDGYEVFTANNGQEGFELIVKEMPDVVLCDIMMPDSTGLDLLEMKQDHEDKAVRAIPVIMLTNLDGDEFIQKAKDLGAVDYIIKSKVANPSEVVAKVEQAVAGRQQPEEESPEEEKKAA
jgi:DNA-binding response OmpR family regulator